VIRVSDWAAGHIAARGGRLYLWQQPVGRAYVRDRSGFQDPNIGVGFRALPAAEIDILVADDLELPEQLTLRRALWPPWKLRIEWNGETWGVRGRAVVNGGA
jgi:hypothetical protein